MLTAQKKTGGGPIRAVLMTAPSLEGTFRYAKVAGRSEQSKLLEVTPNIGE